MPTARENRISLLRRTGIFPAPAPPPPSTCSAMKMVHSSLPRAHHHACPATREKLSRTRLFFSPPPLLPWGDGDRARVPILPPHDCRRRRGGGGRGALRRRHRRTSPPIARYRANCFFLSLPRSAANGREAKRRTEDGGRRTMAAAFPSSLSPFFSPPPFPSAMPQCACNLTPAPKGTPLPPPLPTNRPATTAFSPAL